MANYIKYTFTYSDLAAAALTNSVSIVALPAEGVVEDIIVKHSQEFLGGTITAYTVEVGVVGNTDKNSPAFDVFQAVSDTTIQTTLQLSPADAWSTGDTILITATSVGDDLDQATQGSVDVWVKQVTMP